MKETLGPRFRVRTFGGLAVEGLDTAVPAAVTQRKRLAFLGVLAAAGPRGLPRERLLLLLWPESTAERARGALYQLLYVVRQAFGEGSIVGADELRFDPTIVSSDVADFHAALDRGDVATAVELYRGPFLDAFHVSGTPELERWIEQKRQELARNYQTALSRLIAQAMERGDFATAVGYATRLVDANPLSDRATVLLMEALAASGDVTAALERARIHASVVRQELGADVDPSVSALVARLRRAAANPEAPTARSALPISPEAVAPIQQRVQEQTPRVASVPSARWRKRSFVLAAAAAVVIAVGGFMMLRRTHDKTIEFVVVADFVTDSADRAMAEFLSESTRRALSESRSLRALPESRIANARHRLHMRDDAELTLRLSRQLALGDGVRTVVAGSLQPFRGSYLLSLKLVLASSGDVLARADRPGVTLDKLTDALDILVRTLREKAGDDLQVIHAQPSLTTITSTSLEAMSNYVASKRAPTDEAIALLREAIRLDPAFAAALFQLPFRAVHSGKMGDGEAKTLLKRAYDLRQGLTEYERLRLEAAYLYSPNGKTPSRQNLLEHLREIVEKYPNADDAFQLGTFYMDRRELAAAENAFRQAVSLDSSQTEAQIRIIRILISTNRVAAARRAVDALPPGFPNRAGAELLVTYEEGQRDKVRGILQAATTRVSGDFISGGIAYAHLAFLDLLEGRVADAARDIRISDSLTALRRTAGFPYSALKAEFWVHNRPESGIRMLDSAIAKRTKWSILTYATYYAQFGSPSRARSLLAAYDSLPKSEYTQGSERRLPRGWILIAEGRPKEAIPELRGSTMLSDGPLGASAIASDPDVGFAFERASIPDSAIAAYEHYLNTHQEGRLNDDGFKLPWILEHLAALYAKKGDRDKAIATYSQFVELWRNADPELQPRVTHAREQIATLSRATR